MAHDGYHVLIAEDTTAMAILLRRAFGRAGFTVTVAKDGRDAWEKAQTIRFDLIVTDQQMPRMCGTELCRKLRRMDCYSQTPVIMITAKAYEMDFLRMSEQLKVSAVFVKPFSPAKVLRVAEQCVDARKSKILTPIIESPIAPPRDVPLG